MQPMFPHLRWLMAALALAVAGFFVPWALFTPVIAGGGPLTRCAPNCPENVLQLGQGTLYPALYRLERQGLIRSEWRTTENNRRGRYYSLTSAGRRQFAEELTHWERLSRAINLVLQASLA